uniref:Uncharacterized protein n=1 Tax=Oryza glumipatula TaxID=40148 RepID=A0A0E0BQB7_9ORYZ
MSEVFYRTDTYNCLKLVKLKNKARSSIHQYSLKVDDDHKRRAKITQQNQGQRADVLADDRAGLRRRKVTPTTRTGFFCAPDSVATQERSQIQWCAVSVHELLPRLTPSEQTTSPI